MRRVIGIDIHRTFGEVVFWEDGRLVCQSAWERDPGSACKRDPSAAVGQFDLPTRAYGMTGP